MLVTEKQAKRMVCPEEMGHSDLDKGYCKGSFCMAWRWFNPDEYLSAAGHAMKERLGYCGKAGKPEVIK